MSLSNNTGVVGCFLYISLVKRRRRNSSKFPLSTMTRTSIHERNIVLRLGLQEVLEVDVLLVGHVLKTVLPVNLRASLVKLATHGVINRVSWEAGCFALVTLLLLHPCDEDNLNNDNSPKNAPYGKNALKSVDLGSPRLATNPSFRRDDRMV
jgi:hypothetical protein